MNHNIKQGIVEDAFFLWQFITSQGLLTHSWPDYLADFEMDDQNFSSTTYLAIKKQKQQKSWILQYFFSNEETGKLRFVRKVYKQNLPTSAAQLVSLQFE